MIEIRMDIEAVATQLRAVAEARPLKLPVRRRVDESHHHITDDGLSVWFTIELSPHSRIEDAVFEREDTMPADDECQAWLHVLMPGQEPIESPALPGTHVRRFEAFERSPEQEAPRA
jgi:hypothetical protein